MQYAPHYFVVEEDVEYPSRFCGSEWLAQQSVAGI
jgi:hypothetical protein